MLNVSKPELLPKIHEVLRQKYAKYGPITVISGQGITHGERVQFIDETGRKVFALIKTSRRGRICFAGRDGRWRGLADADRVIVGGPTTFGGDITISMYDQHTLIEAFDANRAARQKAGMSEGVPSWIAPFHEEGRGARGVGDGFGKKALWSEPLSGVVTTAVDEPPTKDLPSFKQAFEALKLAAAREFGSDVEVHLTNRR